MSATIFEPGEGIRTIDLAGTTVTAKADGDTTGDAFVIAETTLAPGGFEPPLHRHREIAEMLYVLAGRLDLQVGDDAGSLPPVPSWESPRASRTRCRSSAMSRYGC